jgi:acetyl-CoA carboxylase carboxyl transferase subunit beta
VKPEQNGRDLSDAWVKCEGCKEIQYRKEVARNAWVCPLCGHHFRIGSQDVIGLLTDPGSFESRHESLRSTDPLSFTDSKKYSDRLRQAAEKSPASDAVVVGMARILGHRVALAVMDFSFMGGSMGSVVGERIARILGDALDEGCPAIIQSSSGGARMQEGIFSLMQMAKTAAQLARLRERGLPYISILTDPTTGGVTASYATLGDVVLAEPKALVGFAGPRVIRETINQELPDGFQRAEFLLQHGHVDAIVDRRQMRETLGQILGFFASARERVGQTARGGA